MATLPYEVGVKLVMSSNHSQVLSALTPLRLG
jgi:hypothetical protein